MLTEEKMKEIESTIREAIVKVQASGIKIVSGHFGLKGIFDDVYAVGDCCCPMTCLIINKNRSAEGVMMVEIAKVLNVTENEIDYFIGGFDEVVNPFGEGTPMFLLGQKFRAEFIKE